jgi:hypothetical protein
MKTTTLLLALTIAAAFTGAALAKAPADATGECKDGTYTKADQKEGACSSHGGVKDWFTKAKAEAPRPANATGQCKDGSYTDAASKSGACSGHQGVKAWYGADAKPSAKAEAKEKPRTETTEKTAPEKKPTQATGTSSNRTTNEQPWVRPTRAAAGGGAGKVWVNTSSKVYHCEKDAYYGKTKSGEYMTESQAKASGARASRGKECS